MHAMIAEKLPEIFHLARERTEPARLRLASLLADIFLEKCELNPRELVMVNEIVDELVGNTNSEVKKILAEKLANSDTAPHRVIMSLANDDNIDVAEQILKTSKKLRDEDLIYVVESHGHDHALAIAERKAISEAVVDALISTGELDVMTTVAENLGAKISPHAMSQLIEAARFGKKLHEPLANRPELTAEMGIRLVWWLDTEVRRKIVSRFGISGGQIDHSLETAVDELFSSLENESIDADTMINAIAWLEERNSLNAKIMIQTLRMGHFKLFTHILAHRTKMDAELSHMIIAEDGGRSMSVLCRALDIDKPSFVSIFLLSRGCRHGEQIVNPKELSQAIGAYDKVDVTTARGLVEGWRRDPSYLLNRFKKAIH